MVFNQRDYQTLIFASFLHDFGKFIQRSNKFPGLKHEDLSALFSLILNLKNKNLSEEIDFNRVKTIIEESHSSEKIDQLTSILKKADSFAASVERLSIDDDNIKPTEVNIRSVFPYLRNLKNQQIPEDFFYKITSVYQTEDDYFFSKKKESFLQGKNEKDYANLLSKENLGFLIKKPLERIDFTFFNLMTFLDEIFYFILTSIPDDRRDLYLFSNLYDHSKLTMILTQGFYFNNKKMIYLKFDIAGIQNFIFKTKTKNATKILRGRSFFLQILNDLITFYFLNHQSLKGVVFFQNQLINFGGNTIFLFPQTEFYNKEKLESMIKDLTLSLLKNFGIKLRYQLDSVSIESSESFKEEFYQALNRQSTIHKDVVFQISNLEDNNDDYKATDDDICEFCEVYKGEKILESGEKICNRCYFFNRLTEYYRKNGFLYFSKTKDPQSFNIFLDYFFHFNKPQSNKDSDFILKSYKKLTEAIESKKGEIFFTNPSKTIFYNIYLPKKEQSIMTFEEIKDLGKGADYLALIKGDVDNMGKIINSIFKSNYDFLKIKDHKQKLSQYLQFARKTNLFFQVYLPNLIEREKAPVYLIYSGGDDFVLVTHWSNVLPFIFSLYEKFCKLTCFNKELTFSSAAVVFKEHEPVLKVVEKAEEFLSRAKKEDKEGKKGKFAFLNSILKINDWKKIETEVKNLTADDEEIIPSSFYYRIYQLASMFKEENEYQKTLSLNKMKYFFLRNFEGYVNKEKDEMKKEKLKIIQRRLRLIFGLEKDEAQKEEVKFIRNNLRTIMEIIILSRRERG